eukprot:4564577-Amphidinium_carterae.1
MNASHCLRRNHAPQTVLKSKSKRFERQLATMHPCTLGSSLKHVSKNVLGQVKLWLGSNAEGRIESNTERATRWNAKSNFAECKATCAFACH